MKHHKILKYGWLHFRLTDGKFCSTLFRVVNQTLQTALLYLVARDVTIAAFEFFNPINGNTRIWLKMQLKKQGVMGYVVIIPYKISCG